MKRYVIMLDSLIDLVEDVWPVTHESDNLATLRARKTFSGNYTPYGPREDYSLRIIESKSLTHALRPGEDYKGAIYEKL